MKTKTERTILLEPLALLLKSRRVLIALCGLIVSALVLAVPELAALRVELLSLLTAVVLALIGGLSWEDAVVAGREKADEPPTSPGDEVGDLIDAILGDRSNSQR
jgi:hypothetical protein